MAYPNDVVRQMLRLQEMTRLQPGVVEAMRRLQEMTRLQPGVVEVMRQFQEATRLQPGVVEAIQSASRVQPGVVKALEAIRLQPGVMQALQDATRFQPGVVQALQEATRLQPSVVKALQDATRVPAQEWSELLSARRAPFENWRTMLDTLRDSALASGSATSTTDWDAAADEVVAEIEETAAAPDDRKLSWLLRRSVVEQLALLVAVLQALDELGKFVTDLAGAADELPPEFRSGVQVLFATVAVLFMVIELRNKSDDD